MRTLLISLLLITYPLSHAASADPSVDFTDLARLVQQTKDRTSHQTGTAIAVIRGGKIIYQGYFGYADIQNKTRVVPDTVFYIASATKPFFALNTLVLEHDHQLDTRASLTTLFPKARFSGFDANAITVRDLLTHTSGIDNQPLVWASAFSGIHTAQSRALLVAQSYPDVDSAHGQFNYSNVGYNIFSVWLDRKVKKPWQTQLQQNIFKPLEMRHSSAYISQARADGWQIAKPYSVMSAKRNQPLYLEKTDATMQAAGGMVSSAPDLARFLIAQLGNGVNAAQQTALQSAIAKSHAQQTKTDGVGYEDFQRAGYAWGWYVGEYKGKTMLHHFGGFAGFHAHLSFIPEANIGLVVLNNEDFLAGKLTNLIADYTYGMLLTEAGIESKAASRFADLFEKSKGLDASVAAQQTQIAARAWQLSLPRTAYVGTYTHPLLGSMLVKLDQAGKMQLTWGRLRAVAAAFDAKDQVRVEFVPNSGQVVQFEVRGKRVEAIQFDRMTFTKAR